MAFNKAPTSLFGASYVSDDTNITIPIADLPGLLVADADETTGDWRALAIAFCQLFYAHYYSLDTADRPAAFKANPPLSSAVRSGDFDGGSKVTYQFEFYTDPATPVVADEPA